MAKPKRHARRQTLSIKIIQHQFHRLCCIIADIIALCALWSCSIAIQSTIFLIRHPYHLVKRLNHAIFGPPWPSTLEWFCEHLALVTFMLPLSLAMCAVEFSNSLRSDTDFADFLYDTDLSSFLTDHESNLNLLQHAQSPQKIPTRISHPESQLQQYPHAAQQTNPSICAAQYLRQPSRLPSNTGLAASSQSTTRLHKHCPRRSHNPRLEILMSALLDEIPSTATGIGVAVSESTCGA